MRYIAVPLAVVCATAVAACGASAPSTGTKISAYTKQVAAAHCMRDHGVPHFPDPTQSGGNPVAQTPGSSTITIAGVAFSGPAFEKAEKLCDALGLGTGRPPVSQATKDRLIAFAECMRRHGLTQWADPTFPTGGGIKEGGGPYSRTDPKVEAAAKACNARS